MKTIGLVFLVVILVVSGCMASQDRAAEIAETGSTPVATETLATATMEATATPGVTVSAPSEAFEVFTYHLDTRGQRVYKSQGMTVAGDLVKTGNCVDGWAQVEYRTEPVERPGYWRVGWSKCEVVYGE